MRSLLLRFASDAKDLIVNELALARTELRVAVRGALSSIPWALAAGMLLLSSLLALAASTALLLAQWLPAWLSVALVGIVLALIALAFLRHARRRFDRHSTAFPRTRRALKSDLRVVSRKDADRGHAVR